MRRDLQDAFDAVRCSEEQKERTKQFLQNKVYQKQKKRRPLRLMIAAAAMVFLLTGISAGAVTVYAMPVATISVDGVPSVQMEVNRMGRVVTVHSYGDADTDLTDSLHHMKYEEAVAALLNSDALSQEKDVSISIASGSDDQSLEMKQQIHQCIGQGNGQRINCHIATDEEASEAKAEDLPLGKYQALLTLQRLDPFVTAEDVRNLSMAEIHRWIRDCNGETHNGQGDGSGHGSGHQNPQGTGQGNGTGSGGNHNSGSGHQNGNHQGGKNHS